MIHVPKVSGAKARIKNILGLMCLLILIAANASAHIYLFYRTVTGGVNDDFGQIVGASVIKVGTLNGVVTEMDGKFATL